MYVSYEWCGGSRVCVGQHTHRVRPFQLIGGCVPQTTRQSEQNPEDEDPARPSSAGRRTQASLTLLETTNDEEIDFNNRPTRLYSEKNPKWQNRQITVARQIIRHRLDLNANYSTYNYNKGWQTAKLHTYTMQITQNYYLTLLKTQIHYEISLFFGREATYA